jgi:drug/metabolite transporter (DMT)-like permease
MDPGRAQPEGRDSAAFGVATAVTALLCWTAAPLFIAHFAARLDPWVSNGWRYGFAALLWSPILARGLRRTPDLLRRALIPAAFNIVGQTLFTVAHYHASPTLVTFGMRAQIVFVSLGAAALFPDERALLRDPRAWVALGMVASGAVGTALVGGGAVGGDPVGAAAAVGAGAMYAAYALGVRAQMTGVPATEAFAMISGVTGLGTVALMLAFGEDLGAPLSWSAVEFGALLLSAVIGIAVGHVAYYRAIAALGVAGTAAIVQLQPVTVGAVSAVLFGERLATAQWGAGALALTGAVALIALGQRVRRREAA